MSDVCTKCGAEPRQGTTKYGANCWRAYRANRKVASKPDAQTAQTVPSAQTPERHPKACPNCQVLADEVAALKRQLAEANARIWPERGMGRPILARAAGDPVGAPKHGPECHCNPCWLERKAGRARRA